jgi:hypothetical protein
MQRIVLSLVSAAVLVVVARQAHAGDCGGVEQARVSGQLPTKEQRNACVAERPMLIASAGGGLEFGTDGGLWGAFVTADVPMLKPLWLSARYRYQAVQKFDLLVGWRFGGSHGEGYDTFVSSQTSTTQTITGQWTTMRTDWVLAAGMKGVIADDGNDIGAIYQVGLQWHKASGFGGHKRFEGYVVARGSRIGGTLAFYNSIPPTGGLVFGMEAGYVPVELADGVEGSVGYWAAIDLGWSFEM